MNYIPEPVTRTDKYLAYIAGNMDVALPDYPITRKEHYLAAWAEKSGFEDVDVAGEPPLTLENAIGKPLKGLKIYGRSKQVTTTGAQLLEKDKVVHPPNGNVRIIVLFEGELSGTYTVSCALEGDAQYPTRAALEIIVNGVSKFCIINSHTVVTGTITKIVCFAQKTYCDFTGTLHIMLNAGSTPLPWEPYTGGLPSPSPDYPQEIESVGQDGKIGVEMCGGNLLDMTEAELRGWNIYNIKSAIKAGQTYTFTNGINATNKIRLLGIKEDGTEFGLTKSYLAPGKSETFVPQFDASITLMGGKDGKTNLDSKYMLNIGSTALPYESYHEPQSMDIATPNGLPGIPVSSGGNYTDVDRQQWICDEVNFGRGVYVQRIAYTVVDGDKMIFKENGVYWNLPRYSSPGCVFSNYHINNFFSDNVFRSNDNHSFLFTTTNWMKKYFDTVDKLNEFCKSKYDAGTPLTLYYALATPIETPITSDQLAAYKQLHTYKGTTIIDNDAGAYMSVKYEKMK